MEEIWKKGKRDDILFKVVFVGELEFVEDCGDVFLELGEVFGVGVNEVGVDYFVGGVFGFFGGYDGFGFGWMSYCIINNSMECKKVWNCEDVCF